MLPQLPKPNRRRRRSRGQGLVELALILPVMLLLLAAAVDFGRLFYTYIGISNAAREGAAYGAAFPYSPQSSITEVAKRELGLLAGDPSVTITVSCSAGVCVPQPDSTAGNKITVRVAQTGGFKLLTPVLGQIFSGDAIPMSATATAMIQ